jgi:hypothetical protein
MRVEGGREGIFPSTPTLHSHKAHRKRCHLQGNSQAEDNKNFCAPVWPLVNAPSRKTHGAYTGRAVIATLTRRGRAGESQVHHLIRSDLKSRRNGPMFGGPLVPIWWARGTRVRIFSWILLKGEPSCLVSDSRAVCPVRAVIGTPKFERTMKGFNNDGQSSGCAVGPPLAPVLVLHKPTIYVTELLLERTLGNGISLGGSEVFASRLRPLVSLPIGLRRNVRIRRSI